MGFFSKITKPFKKAANKVIKPFQKVSDKLIPNELRPLLPYSSMFLPASGIMGQLCGLCGFGKILLVILAKGLVTTSAAFLKGLVILLKNPIIFYILIVEKQVSKTCIYAIVYQFTRLFITSQSRIC